MLIKLLQVDLLDTKVVGALHLGFECNRKFWYKGSRPDGN